MAKKKRDTFRLGLTVIGIFVLFVAVLMFIGKGFQGERQISFVVRFPHTLSLPLLEEDADIIGFGRVIGKVKDLRQVEAVDPDRPSAGETLFLEIEGKINESVELRQDCSIVAEGPVLGGRGYLRIADRGRAEPIDPTEPVYGRISGFSAALEMAAAELDAKNPAGLLGMIKAQLDAERSGSLLAKVHVSLDDVNTTTHMISLQTDPEYRDALITKLSAVLENLNKATGYLRDQLTPGSEDVMLAKFLAVLDALNRGLAQATAMLEENRPHIAGTIQSVEKTAATLDTGIAGPIARELDKNNPDGVLSMVSASFERIVRSLDDLNVVTDKSKRVVVLNAERLSGLIANASETSDHLKAAAEDLRRNPWRLLYRPSLEQTKELNIFDAAREFSEAAARLDDSTAQLRSILESKEGSIPSDDPDLAKIRAQLLETFDRFKSAEKTLWEQLGAP